MADRAQNISCREPDLLFQGHDQNSSNLEKTLHVLFMLFLHTSPTVHPIILRTIWGNLQAIANNKGGLTEVEPGRKNVFSVSKCTTLPQDHTKIHADHRVWFTVKPRAL